MSDHPNAELARIAWQAVSIGDVETLTRVCSEDLVWHASGRGSRSGDYEGRDAVFEYLATIGDAAERFDSHLEQVLANDELSMVLFRVQAERGAKRLDTGFILIFRIEEGRLAEVWSVPRDQYAVDEFWS